MKLKTSTKIAISFVVLLGGGIFGYEAINAYLIDKTNFPEILPGRVTLLGLAPGSGYKVIVSNQIAQLVQTDEKLGVGEMSEGSGEGTDKRRIPLREMLQSLQGDTIALGKLVTTMNEDLRKADIPPTKVYWKADDVEKALHGDQKLREKLERDINIQLDGTPTQSINLTALLCGIVIKVPVTVDVNVAGVVKKLTCEVEVPYRANFTRKVEDKLTEKGGLNPSDATIRGYYMEVAKALQDKPSDKENIAKGLEARLNFQSSVQHAEAAERVLKYAQVILNENYISKASMQENTNFQDRKLYDLVLDLTDEGRNRLWKYSRHRVGNQLLLTVDGIAIAAPRIRHELAQKNVNITQLADESLVQDAVDLINSTSRTAHK